MTDLAPAMPTAEQCGTNACVPAPLGWANRLLGRRSDWPAWAAWYPQMGGYIARCVVMPEEEGPDSCWSVWVWHDGEFPFHEGDEKNPHYLHHCDAEQFIDFGELLLSLAQTGQPTPDDGGDR